MPRTPSQPLPDAEAITTSDALGDPDATLSDAESDTLPSGPRQLDPRWTQWVIENLSRDAPRDALVEALLEEGVPLHQARELVSTVAQSAGIREARRLWRRVQALEQIVRLRRDHRRGHEAIRRGPLPDIEEFKARHWLPGVPLVVTDLVTRWPAFSRWSPADFAERFGDVKVQACEGRREHAKPDSEWQDLTRTMTMRELVARITDDATGNDLYVIAKNGAWGNPELAPLFEELDLPPQWFQAVRDPMKMGLWIGGRGTHTPLHHDAENAMLCQVHGRKRIRLAPPESLPLLDRSRGVYSRWDPTGDDPIDDPEALIELELNPGEALYVPAGWWHQVDALDPSITVTLLAWAWPNEYRWYRPGTLLAGRGG